MPLVEVIRAPSSSDAAIATVVAYAQAMGKSAIVVNDGPGFLVNRVLAPYMVAFQLLVADGAPIEAVDKAMEGFGWPMGPAFLSDVVGLDTAHHAGEVMAQAFPDQYPRGKALPGELLFKAGYLGQKNGKGFYRYETDKKGESKKQFDPAVYDVIRPAITASAQPISGEEIVERMMLPMVLEAARCLEQKIVDTPTELDMALILGLGFPPFRGGLLRWADRRGLSELCSAMERYSRFGKLYEPTAKMKELANAKKGFY
jgi:3-hydroxyacyl-CoA dehydrogenase/enoyl-CoA hydratase/3-hydroxybutyryl-CoA epimerase/enoyl-CoA isomerase